ncbi:hypothetical protein [Sphingomonas sp.]|uniref:hypothetical protein n=1 Tax=Sphingomonas sp. TaxID=28214 RepID=UPI003D6D1380
MHSQGIDTNVVRLPTAAKRKVGQPYNKAAQAERIRLRGESPLAHRFALPFTRLAAKHELVLRSLVRTPELCIALAIYGALPPEQQRAAGVLISRMASRTGDTATLQALFSTAERTITFQSLDRWAAQLARAEVDHA